MITKYLISLDSLEVQYAHQPQRVDFFDPATPADYLDLFSLLPDKAADAYESGAFQFKRLKNPGRYRLAYVVSCLSEPFATLHLLPTSHVTSLNGKVLIHVKYAKQLLYTAHLPTRANLFLSTFHLRENNVTYYELALDTNEDANSLFSKAFFSPRLHFLSRDRTTDKILEVAALYRTGQRESSYYINNENRREDIVIIFYCKTIANNKGKGYEAFIKAHHALNGLDTNELIYRIEVRAPRKAMTRYRSIWVRGDEQLISPQYKNLSAAGRVGYVKQTTMQDRAVTLADLVNPVKMKELFKLDFTALVDFRLPTREDVSKCQKMYLVDFDQVAKHQFIVETKISDNLDMNFEKMEIKNSLTNYKYTKKQVYLDAATEAAATYGLTSYFNEQRIKLLRLPAPVVVPPVPVATISEDWLDF